MTTRRFVLEPGVEIAAGMRHPGSGSTLRELLDNISVPQPLVVVVGPPGSGATTVAAAVADATLARPLFAPVPVPESVSLADWRAAAIAWARPLATADRTDADPFTVADCWLEALPLAAADRLDPAAAEALDAEVATLAAGAAAANVAILLDVAETVLEDRLAADDAAGGTLVRAARPGAVAEAVAFQRRLVRRLRCPGDRTPRAVVTVDAADLERATADAVAAVEAML